MSQAVWGIYSPHHSDAPAPGSFWEGRLFDQLRISAISIYTPTPPRAGAIPPSPATLAPSWVALQRGPDSTWPDTISAYASHSHSRRMLISFLTKDEALHGTVQGQCLFLHLVLEPYRLRFLLRAICVTLFLADGSHPILVAAISSGLAGIPPYQPAPDQLQFPPAGWSSGLLPPLAAMQPKSISVLLEIT
jgi:hypothetical protein